MYDVVINACKIGLILQFAYTRQWQLHRCTYRPTAVAI